MVAMRVCVKCMASTASKNMAMQERSVRLVSCLTSRYITGSMRTPISAPMKRQPNGVMPNSSMPIIISVLPSGGCVHS